MAKRKEKYFFESINPYWEDLYQKISQSNEKILLRNDLVKNINGIIITAGLSTRMGKFKPLLKYNGRTFLENIICKLDLICNQIIIVTGFNSEKVTEIISAIEPKIKTKIVIVYNENYNDGMFSSLKVGIEHFNTNWVIYHFVDQPNIPENIYLELSNQIDITYDWIQPINKGRKGHPIIFGKNVISKIKQSNFDSSLRIISQSNEIKKYFWECNFEEILSDIDTEQDYLKII
ncbi:MAG: nucleotidyltransferase family protein [Melioribacteraceae bacterium]